ncbi:MAG: hypothetical protein ACERLG_09540, partial [Sedimentibacter sp.]
MIKKIFSLVLSLVLISSFSTSVLADSFTKYNPDSSVIYNSNNVKKYEKKVVDNNFKEVGITPMVVDPGDGAVRTTYSARFSSGYTYEDSNKSSSVLSTIWNTSLTISGYFFSTAGNIVKDVALLAYSINENEIVQSSPGTAKLLHSYS